MLSVTYHPQPPSPHTTITTTPLPPSPPPPGHLLIKIHTAATNPKDHSHPASKSLSQNSGDDCAGTVVEISPPLSSSPNDRTFRIGDRVACFHPMGAPWGTYAEYTLAPAHTTIRIPPEMAFDDAATIPLVAFTAAVTLWRRQLLPSPFSAGAEQATTRQPLVVYGAGSALGSYIIQLAKASPGPIGPIVAIAGGSGRERLGEMLEAKKGDVLLDYRTGVEVWVPEARGALGGTGGKAQHVVDCISGATTWAPLVGLVARGGRLSVTSGARGYEDPAVEEGGVRVVYTFVGTVHKGEYYPGAPRVPEREEVEGEVEWAGECAAWFETALESGLLKPHPWTKIPGGLNGVEEGLRRIRENEVKGRKFVYNIEETPK